MSTPRKSRRRALRAALIVDDKVYDEVHHHAPERVTVGTDIASRLLVFGDHRLPKRHVLFDVAEDGAYILDLPPGVRGQIKIRGRAKAIRALWKKHQSSGSKARSLRLRLDRSARGKLTLGESTLLFFFDKPAPYTPPPPFPDDLRPALRGMLSRLELASLLSALIILGPYFTYIANKEVPVDVVPEIDERFLNVMEIPKPRDEPPPEEEEEEEEDPLLAQEDDEKQKDDEEKVEQVIETKKEYSAKAMEKARGVGVLRALGTYGGDGPGTVFDVIQSTENNTAELFAAGMTRTINADSGDVSGFVPGGEGISAAGAVVGTKGFEVTDDGPELKDMEKQERKIKSKVKAGDADVLGDMDKRAVQATIRRRMGALQNCYNRALRTNPGLSGKMTYTITISVMGTVTSVNIDADTVRDPSVASCTTMKIKNWRFPAEGAEDSSEVTFTVVFSGES
ncbi:MAG: AgmX/PglI C-terminal domain-containing protein [Myxococcales bacterium]|nr:AgmX/PglI C-terminal domain-containing protein [Myxococcales bacterium]